MTVILLVAKSIFCSGVPMARGGHFAGLPMLDALMGDGEKREDEQAARTSQLAQAAAGRVSREGRGARNGAAGERAACAGAPVEGGEAGPPDGGQKPGESPEGAIAGARRGSDSGAECAAAAARGIAAPADPPSPPDEPTLEEDGRAAKPYTSAALNQHRPPLLMMPESRAPTSQLSNSSMAETFQLRRPPAAALPDMPSSGSLGAHVRAQSACADIVAPAGGSPTGSPNHGALMHVSSATLDAVAHGAQHAAGIPSAHPSPVLRTAPSRRNVGASLRLASLQKRAPDGRASSVFTGRNPFDVLTAEQKRQALQVLPPSAPAPGPPAPRAP